MARAGYWGGLRGDHYDFQTVLIQIHAPEGVSLEDEVRFEPLRVGGTPVLHEAHQEHAVMERTSIPLKPPKRCLEGICDWSLLLIGPQIEWQLAAPPEIGLNVGVAEVVPAELASEPVTGEPIRIGRDEVVRLVATVKVDASLVSGQDFVVMGPVVAVEFRLDRDTTDAHLMFARDTGFATTSEDSTTVAINQVALECDNLTCSAVVELPLSFSEQAEGTVTWEAQAYIPYMPGGQLPAGAVVDLEVER